MYRGLNTRYSIRCLLRCPAHAIVANDSTAKYDENAAIDLLTPSSTPLVSGDASHIVMSGSDTAARICPANVLSVTTMALHGIFIRKSGMKALSHCIVLRTAWWPVVK
ncbi:hypothetical protein VUR80DRAFT_9352 [Thermomyces stellatus]